MKLFVYSIRWPFEALTVIGRLSRLIIQSGPDHVGLLFVDCDEAQVQQHASLGGSFQKHVRFDFLNKPGFFNVCDDDFFIDASKVAVYRVDNLDAAVVHKYCCQVAQYAPSNSFLNRMNAALRLPFSLASSGSPSVASSDCAALTLRLVACAMARSSRPLVDDAFASQQLALPSRCDGSSPLLTTYTPQAAIDALEKTGLAGRTLYTTLEEAVKGGVTVTIFGAPDQIRMSRNSEGTESL